MTDLPAAGISRLTEEEGRELIVSLLLDLAVEREAAEAAQRMIHGLSMIIDGYCDLFPPLRALIPEGALTFPPSPVASKRRRRGSPTARVSTEAPVSRPDPTRVDDERTPPCG